MLKVWTGFQSKNLLDEQEASSDAEERPLLLFPSDPTNESLERLLSMKFYFRAALSIPLLTVLVFSGSTLAVVPAYKLPINFHVVTKSAIYRGARPQSQESINYLRDIGVKTVIDLQGGDLDNFILGLIVPFFENGEKPEEIAQERQTITSNRMAFFNFPLNSLGNVSNDEATRIDRVLKMMDDPKFQPVYVHCAHGADRTGLVIALYRVKYQHWTRARAYAEMIDNGHNLLHMLGTFGMDGYLFKESLRKYFDQYWLAFLGGMP